MGRARHNGDTGVGMMMAPAFNMPMPCLHTSESDCCKQKYRSFLSFGNSAAVYMIVSESYAISETGITEHRWGAPPCVWVSLAFLINQQAISFFDNGNLRMYLVPDGWSRLDPQTEGFVPYGRRERFELMKKEMAQ